MIKQIVSAVTIPVMAKVRIGHIVEAQASRESKLLSFPPSDGRLANRYCKPSA